MLLIKNKTHILLILTTLFSYDFIPENNSQLNYRQIEFSWPQVPNSNSYKIIINNLTSDYSTTILSEKNITIYDGYDLDWNSQYSWQACGLNGNTTSECHPIKYFNLSELSNLIPPILEIIHLEEDQIKEGLTIFSGIFQGGAIGLGIDKNANILWISPHRMNYKILKNGHFLSRTGSLQEIDLNGNIIFNSDNLGFHHSIHKTSNDTYFGIINVEEIHDCPIGCNPIALAAYPNGIPWLGDKILEIDSDNNILWEWDLFEEIGVDNYYAPNIENVGPANNFIIDWTHTNEVFYDELSNSVYISIRNLNTITKIDYNSKDVIWHLGDLDTLGINSYFNEHPSFIHQHTPILLDNQNLILFNNGGIHTHDPKISKCQEYEINDNSFELVWEYTLADSLYTGARGECHRLSNNNTLIATGQTSNFIEINNQNEIVWHGVAKSSIGSSQIGRIMKIDNLYPSSFNIEFENYFGSISDPQITLNNNTINLTINNNGWLNDEYEIFITNDNNEIYYSLLNIQSYTSQNININVSELNLQSELESNQLINVTFSIYSKNLNFSKNYNVNLLINDSELNSDITSDEYTLSQNFPNPFNPNTTINFSIPETNYLSMNLIDIRGRIVKNIFNDKYYSIGEHSVKINISDLNTGIYFIQLISDKKTLIRKITLIK